MRKLIRNKNTRVFLTETGEWTADKAKACDFLWNGKCLESLAEGLPELEWYYWFPESYTDQYDFTTPVAPLSLGHR